MLLPRGIRNPSGERLGLLGFVISSVSISSGCGCDSGAVMTLPARDDAILFDEEGLMLCGDCKDDWLLIEASSPPFVVFSLDRPSRRWRVAFCRRLRNWFSLAVLRGDDTVNESG